MRRVGWTGPVLAAVLPLLLFFWLRSAESSDYVLRVPTGHFYIVSAVALLSTGIAVIVGIAGSRLRDIKVTVLSLAFVSLAEVFAVHGLATPHLLVHTTRLATVTSPLSVLLASFWLWISTLPSDHKIMQFFARVGNRFVIGWTVILGVLGVTAILRYDWIERLPFQPAPWDVLVTSAVILFCGVAAWRYHQAYLQSRFPLQISVVYSCALMIVSPIIMVVGESWRVSWWLYHFLLLAAMIIMVAGVIRQHAGVRPFPMAFRALFAADPVERVTSSLPPGVRALVLATESRDPYTAGHNFRVTLYALKIGEELGLSPTQMRALAQGTIVHDVGKIRIPDAILNKPGKLTPEERSIIEQHPVVGYEICRRLGFMKEELDIIRYHHERWDGTGYPDGLAGERIPLLARVVAVADVYDALTSHRAYRPAWTHEQTLELIRQGRGTHFDPQCVDAWLRVCAREPKVYEYPNALIGQHRLHIFSAPSNPTGVSYP
ncbi:MAG TPA: HD-GYP domain-containing protein [Paenibacillaceae bacterium]